MTQKLKNRAITREEAQLSSARNAAKAALQRWYQKGFYRADAIIPKLQIESNLKEVASIPGWQEQKGSRNGYVMLTTLVGGTLKPIILVLDYEAVPCGGLTYRQLHQQIREALGLEPKVSLRMCPFRPWYRHVKKSFPIPEHCVLPATDDQCTHLLGTTLLYYTYVHLQ